MIGILSDRFHRMALLGFGLLAGITTDSYAQINVTATGGAPTGSYATLSAAFAAINAGGHTGTIAISVDGSTTEPAAPAALAASGQGSASYTAITIKPTVTAVIAGATGAGSAVVNMDGADNVTIDGSIAVGGTSRDLTIQNTAAATQANVAAIRLIGRTTLGLGATNITIKNCLIIGNTPGNDGFSGSTITSSYGIYAGSSTAATMSNSTGSADYDNLTIENNEIKKAYVAVHVFGATSPNQADNLIIRGNSISSTVDADRSGLRGISLQQINVGLIQANTIQNIKNNADLTVSGIELGGASSSAVHIDRNKIIDIQSLDTDGWGAHGINITNGANHVITNNVIHGIATTNYSATSTLYNAYGIRMTGGTGHKIYYNSINMYGNYTNTNYTLTMSAALLVTSTSVTGLEIKNNIFANKITSNAATVEMMGVLFASGYNFANAVLDNNAYHVSNDAQHHIGKVGTTTGANNGTTLSAWKALSQVNNATNDVNSHPSGGNSNAPFTADNNLVIPAGTATPMESGAVAIAALGLPNVDHNNVNRPAGAGTAPDIGAYEFAGTAGGDFTAPVIGSVMADPASGQCDAVAHAVDAVITDAVGVTTATLSYSYNGVAQTPIAMTMTSGTATNGTWSATIPAAPAAAVVVMFSVAAADAAGNAAGSVAGTAYADDYLTVTASADQTIALGSSATIWAATNDPVRNKVLITEVIQNKGGTGDGTYPAYVPVADNDFVELTNLGDAVVNLSGYKLELLGGVTTTYTIPNGVVLQSGQSMLLAFSATTNSPANNYYGMGVTTTTSGVAMGYILRNNNNAILDVIGTNGYTFAVNTGVTAGDWTGNIASSSGLAGVRRTVAADNDNATDWTLSGAANLTNPGAINAGLTISSGATMFTWNPGGASTDTLTVTPATAGTHMYIATYSDGTCTASDTVMITAQMPTPPVANFSATPVTGPAPTTVMFTDLSANLPNTWNWTITPATGFAYTGGTTAASQNPQIQFTTPGYYTVMLEVSNAAGSDDTTMVDYIFITPCAPTYATGCGSGDAITNVTLNTLNNASTCTASPFYTFYNAVTVPDLQVGGSQNISISFDTDGNQYAGVWIDYNQDLDFDDAGEFVGNNTVNAGASGTTIINFTVPGAATLGQTLMRVRGGNDSQLANTPCGASSSAYGETEDYIVNITNCVSALPVVMTDTVCTGSTATVMATGNSIAWYDAPTGGNLVSSNATFTTGVLTANTSYYAENTDSTCDVSARVAAAIVVGPALSVMTGATDATCDGVMDGTAAVTTGGSGTGPYDFMWSNGSTAQSVTGLAADTYMVTVTDAYGCMDVDTVVINNSMVVTVDLGVDTANCGGAIVLDATAAFTSYMWSDNSTSQTLSAATSGTYGVTVMDANGCQAMDDVVVTINTPTPVTVTGGSGCDMFVADAGAGFASYVWSDNSTGQTLTLMATGSYSVTVTDANGCTATDSNAATVNASPSVTVTGGSGCDMFVADAGAGFAGYVWSDNSTGQTLTLMATGSYSVTVTDANGCTATDANAATVNPSPSVDLGMDSVLCQSSNDTFMIEAGAGFATYLWTSNPTGAMGDGATTSGILVDANGLGLGTFEYVVEVMDGNNCSATDTVVVMVDVCAGVAGTDKTYDVQVFPNPNNGAFALSFTDLPASESMLQMMDAQGRLLSAQQVTGATGVVQLDFNHLPSGVYMVRLVGETFTHSTKVVIVR